MDVAPLDTLKSLQESFVFLFFPPSPLPLTRVFHGAQPGICPTLKTKNLKKVQHETAEKSRAQPMQCNAKTPVHHTPAFSEPSLQKTQK